MVIFIKDELLLNLTKHFYMDISKRKEQLSVSYLHAVCAYAGAKRETDGVDSDGIDGTISKQLNISGVSYRARIEYQLKSTSMQLDTRDNTLFYDLKVKNYNDLVVQSTCPSYLFLLILPQEETEWLHVETEQLILKRCMYWYSLNGFTESSNHETVTLHIPLTNIVTPDLISSLLVDDYNQKVKNRKQC